MSVLVTGGAGYIGSHTVRRLVEHGFDVVVLDTLELGSKHAVGDVQLVVGDVADRTVVDPLLADYSVDSIIHFAAYKNVGESMRDPGRYFANNVGGTLALLEAARDHGISRFVFSSSCSVYGTPDRSPVDESAAIHPESAYAATKAVCEEQLKWFDAAHGLRFASLRYFNASGAAVEGGLGEQADVALNLIPVAMQAILGERPPLQVFGSDYPTPDGTCIRDYIHVDDLAEAHIAALRYLVAGGESGAFNLGTGTGSSVKQVLDASARISGREVPHDYVDRRAGDPSATFADNRKAREVLGWHPRYGLEEIIESAWRWHARHTFG